MIQFILTFVIVVIVLNTEISMIGTLKAQTSKLEKNGIYHFDVTSVLPIVIGHWLYVDDLFPLIQ